MIRVSVLYPTTEGATFDMDYYINKHIPMVQEKLGAACKGASVDAGLGGGAPGQPPAYVCIGNLLFDSVEDFQNSFGPHAGPIMGDIPNYTSIAPVVQVSEIKL